VTRDPLSIPPGRVCVEPLQNRRAGAGVCQLRRDPPHSQL